MKQITIKAKAGTRYMDQIPEIITEYGNDLPHNAVIDKQVTGIGGTHLVLTNDVPYVVAVHLKKMIINKVEQDAYKHVQPVDGDVSKEEIEDYLSKGGIKFLCTYDSVPRLQRILGDRAKSFNLLIDEVHCLISYMDKFKPSVAVQLIKGAVNFNSTSYLTATPTNYNYLPEPLKALDQVKIEWENARKPDLVHAFSNRSLSEDLLSTALDILDNTQDEVYIFYNSRRYVVNFIRKLFKAKPELNLNDINILFSESEANTVYFKKYIGAKFEYGEFPNGSNNKRINLISSMGFEGCDFYPNKDPFIKPVSIVVSDPKSKTMRFDIKVQLKQICGRFRAIPDSNGVMPHNKIIYLWCSQEEDIILNEEEYLNMVEENNTLCAKGLVDNKDNKMIMDSLKLSANSHHAYWILDENKEVMLHPYAVSAQMSNYHALHSDAYVLDDRVEESTTVSKLADLSKDLSTFKVPSLPSQYKTILGRIPSVQSLVKEYYELIDSSRINPTFVDDLDTFLTNNTEFSEWLDAGVTPQNMNTIKNRAKIQDLASSLRIMAKTEEVSLPFKAKQVYSKAEIKNTIQKFYDSKNIKIKAKATDIKKWYNVIATTNKQNESSFKIIKKL